MNRQDNYHHLRIASWTIVFVNLRQDCLQIIILCKNTICIKMHRIIPIVDNSSSVGQQCFILIIL